MRNYLNENSKNVLGVLEINKYIKQIINKDHILSNLFIKGEISNYKYHSSGHMYFTLKENNSVIRCVMFKSHSSKLKFKPENGQKVIINGYISVYERDGQYQLYVEGMTVDGIGNFHLAFEQLKEKLQKEGLFEHRFKKQLPMLPKKIGVVTSQTGSVIRDIINVLNRRYNNFRLIIYPVSVQGETSAREVSNGINCFNRLDLVDVIIIARGGGSLEELWSFNEEIVARAIFYSKIPIVSAIGHETDFTISDFVADQRAPTPSSAAELVLPEKQFMYKKINDLQHRLNSIIINNIQLKKQRLKRLKESFAFTKPYDRLNQNSVQLDMLKKDLIGALLKKTEKEKASMRFLIGKLDSLSPLNVLSRGYGVVRKEDKIIRSVKDLKTNQNIKIEITDGVIDCSIDQISIKEVTKNGE